jgi:O-antigen/teichoic acid export membrane protein
MSQLKKGALLSYINIVLTNIIGLLLTPYIVRNLGNSEYGLYLLIGSIITYISVMDLGLNNSVIRYVSLYKAEDNPEKEKKLISTLFLVYLIICVSVLIIGTIIYCYFDKVFSNSLTSNEIELGKKMFIVLLFNLILSLPGGIFSALCNAYQMFVFPRFLQIIKYVLRAFLVYLVLFMDGGALSLVIIDSVLNLLVIGITIFYTIYHLNIRYELSFKIDKIFLLEILSYTIWGFLAIIAFQLQWNIGQTVLGINFDTSTVAVFGVGVILGGYYGAFAGVINTLLLPKATKLFSENKNGYEYTSEMIKVARINLILLLLILGGFILFGKLFILLWLNESYLQAWEISLSIMIVMTLPLVQAFGNSILEAHLKNRFRAIFYISTLSVASFFSYYLSINYGIYGALLPLLCAIVINSIGLFLYFKIVFGFEIIRFWKEVFIKPIYINIILLIVSYLILKCFILENWLHLLTAILIFSIIYCIVNYFLVLNNNEKKLIKI